MLLPDTTRHILPHPPTPLHCTALQCTTLFINRSIHPIPLHTVHITLRTSYSTFHCSDFNAQLRLAALIPIRLVDQNGRSVRARGKYVSSKGVKSKGAGYEGLGLGEGEEEEGTEFGSPIPHDTSLTLGKHGRGQGWEGGSGWKFVHCCELFYSILCYTTLSHLTLSHPILYYPIPSYHSSPVLSTPSY